MENANQSVEDGREGDAEGAVEDGEGGREVLEGGGRGGEWWRVRSRVEERSYWREGKTQWLGGGGGVTLRSHAMMNPH